MMDRTHVIGNRVIHFNILWNTVGNAFYLICQWLLNVVVVRLSGNYIDAGILSLSVSITNIFGTLALFNIRNYQVSDLINRYSQSDYIAHRIITSSFSLIFCILFCVFSNYQKMTAMSIISYMLTRVIEALADVLHGFLQKQWRLDIVGKSGVFRGIAQVLTFSLIYLITGSLPLALFSMFISVTLIFLLYDIRATIKLGEISFRFQRSCLLSLTKECLPVLGYGLFIGMITPCARFFIERYHGEEALGYYGSVSTIAVAVQAVSAYIFAPLNGIISKYYMENNQNGILRISMKIIISLIVFAVLAVIGAVLFGDSILAILFGKSILPYTYLLVPTIISSCLTGLVWFLGMLLIIMRKIKPLIIDVVIGLVLSVVLSITLIPVYQFDGANATTIISLSFVAMLYIGAVGHTLMKKRVIS